MVLSIVSVGNAVFFAMLWLSNSTVLLGKLSIVENALDCGKEQCKFDNDGVNIKRATTQQTQLVFSGHK